MNKRLLLIAVAAAMLCHSSAQVNSAGADGYLIRAEAMMLDDNYIGCLDQVGQALRLPMSPEQQMQALYLQGAATVHTDRLLARQLLSDFLAKYPGSSLQPQAMMALADTYYGFDYARASEIYTRVDATKLTPAQKAQLDYRRGYCLMELGYYDSAYQLFSNLSQDKAYSKKAQFYKAYIRYAQGKYAEALPMFEASRSNEAPGNMADYYLSQIYYIKGDNSQALAMAKSLLQRQGIEQQYVAEANRIAGEAAFKLGDDDEATKYLNSYLRLAENPQPSALYILGLQAYNQGEYNQAVQLMTPATELGDAMSQSAYLYIGQALLKEGDTDGAVLAFDKALNMEFDREVQETAFYNYAVASLQGGRVPFGNSIATFEAFIKRYPNSAYAPQAQQYIVAAYLNNKNYDQALASINSMARPTDATQAAKQKVLYMLGAQSLGANNPQAAISYLQQAQELAKYDRLISQESTLLLGEALYRNGDYAASARQLEAYIKNVGNTQGNLAIAEYDLGYARFAQKQYAAAAQEFNSMLKAPGKLSASIQADAYNRLGDCYFYQSKFADAADAYQEAYNLSPYTGDYALLQRGLMEGYQRHHQRKIDILSQMEREFPQSALVPEALLEMTESYIQLGDNKGAIAIYEELVEKYPNTSQGRQGSLQMALTMLNAGEREQAIQAYRNVVTRYPSSDEAAQAAEQLKRLYADDGRVGEYLTFINSIPNGPKMDISEADDLTFESAEKYYITNGDTSRIESYLTEYPDGGSRAKALAYLMEAADAAGNTKAAYDYACQIVRDYPDNSLAIPALQVKAETEYADGRGALALRTWQDLEGKASTPTALNAARLGIARCANDTQEYGQAITACDALLQSSLDAEDRTEALYLKGVALNAQGHTSKARQAWKEAAPDTNSYYGMGSAYLLAESYFNAGDLDQAEKLAKDVTDADTPYSYWVARGFILLSDIYAKQGNDFKAQQYLKSLQENYPGSETDIFQMIQQRIK